MAWTVPDELEEAVHAAARAALGDAALATGALIRAIVDRSQRYTSERGRPAANPTGDLAARAAFFTIADAMKIAIPLGELAKRGALPAARPLRIVDVGAGCGAMSLGAIAALPPGTAVDIVAIDRDAAALAIARAAIGALAARRGVAAALATREADAARAALPATDLVVLGSVLNELPPDARLAAVLRALAAIGDDGAVIAVEPALRDTTRALHELRDQVIAGGHGHAFAPCTRAAAPCPALADPDDWCHEDRPLQLPRRTAELARLTHLRDAGMKFAYLVLRRRPLALALAPHAWRVVSAPMPAKGKLEVIGCSARGRMPLRLLRRHRAPGNRAIEDASRGDVLVVDAEAAAGADRLEITADTTVERLSPAMPDRGVPADPPRPERRPEQRIEYPARMTAIEFVDVATARSAPGVRIVVSGLVPSPWSEAAKGLFRIANVPVLAVRRARDGAEITAWTGADNVPVVLHGDELPRTNWAAITALAARLGAPGAVLPDDVTARARAMGLIHEIAGEDGLGWNARLAMIDASITSEGKRGFPLPVGQYLARRYGYTPDAAARGRARIERQLHALGDQLRDQKARGHAYLAGPEVSALDVYLATFLTPLAPITPDVCPKLEPPLRAGFGAAHEAFGALVPDELWAHRQMVFERHLAWPIAL